MDPAKTATIRAKAGSAVPWHMGSDAVRSAPALLLVEVQLMQKEKQRKRQEAIDEIVCDADLDHSIEVRPTWRTTPCGEYSR